VQPPREEPARAEESALAPAHLRMTYEEYLHWADEDVHAEWVDGEVLVQMPPKDAHQRLVEFLDRLLGLYVELFGLGLVRLAPYELRLRPEGPARQPDLMFLATAHLDRLTPERVIGPPDLIIEVVSDESVQRDHVEKFAEYEAARVPEYWVLDNRPGHQHALFYRLGPEGRYKQVLPDEQDIYRSAVLEGFWLRVAWLWEAEPNVLRALAEILGPERLLDALRRATAASGTEQSPPAPK
jgi:Uma2 family endonuclease